MTIKSKYKTIFLCFALLTLIIGCNKSEDNGTTNNDPEPRISTYELTFSGGVLDGQIISGSFPNDLDNGGGGYLDAQFSNSSKNEVTIGFNDRHDQDLTGAMSGTFLLDGNSEALPVGIFPYDIDSLSTLNVIITTDTTSFNDILSYASTSGTCSVSNVVVGPNVGGSVYSDYDAEFDGEFRNSFDPDEGDVIITGVLHIRSIRN